MEAKGSVMSGERGSAERHLDAASWRALLEAPRPDGPLLEHLAAGCEVCDAFLATHVDELDGAVDRALLRLGPVRLGELDEVGWMRLQRRLGAGAVRTRRRVIGAALAASLVVALGLSLVRPGKGQGWDGLKRSASMGPTLQLSAALRHSDQAFVRLDDGARLSAGAVLVLRATSSIDGPARVFLERAGQAPIEVGQVAMRAGTHELQTEAGLLGVTLEGERGEVRVWVVVGEAPFSAETALEAIASPHGGDVVAASIRVQVD
jgi:hypothetical protein